MVSDGKHAGARVEPGKAIFDELGQLPVKEALDHLTLEELHTGDLSHGLRKLQDCRVKPFGLCFDGQPPVLFRDPVLGQDAVEDPQFVLRIQLVVVGEPHQRHAMVADAHAVGPVGRCFDEDVHHVAVFVKQRSEHLEDPGPALPECQVSVELLFQ
jgi:hypothetical protein